MRHLAAIIITLLLFCIAGASYYTLTPLRRYELLDRILTWADSSVDRVRCWADV